MGALRRIVASWCVNHKADGGLELPPKVVHERLGHSSITITRTCKGTCLTGLMMAPSDRGGTPVCCLK
jgi:integrase